MFAYCFEAAFDALPLAALRGPPSAAAGAAPPLPEGEVNAGTSDRLFCVLVYSFVCSYILLFAHTFFCLLIHSFACSAFARAHVDPNPKLQTKLTVFIVTHARTVLSRDVLADGALDLRSLEWELRCAAFAALGAVARRTFAKTAQFDVLLWKRSKGGKPVVTDKIWRALSHPDPGHYELTAKTSFKSLRWEVRTLVLYLPLPCTRIMLTI